MRKNVLGCETQEETAICLGVHIQTIKNLEGGGVPDLDTLNKIYSACLKEGLDINALSLFK